VFFGFDIFVLVIVVLAILTLFAGVKTVPQGFNWTVERFGKYTNTLRPGLNLIVPYFDRIGRKMNTMEQAVDIPEQDVITKDNATVTVDGLAFFQVIDAAKASYEIANLDQAIVKLTMTNIRSVMGAMDLDQMLSHRDEINERLFARGRRRGEPVGREGQPHRDQGHRAAREPRAVDGPADAGRTREAGGNLAGEGLRQSAILKAEGAKQSQILEAEGRREAAFRDAEARERLAQAEAKATEMVSAAVRARRRRFAQLLHRAEIYRGVRQAGDFAEPESADPPDGSDQRARLARRHRRDRQGDIRVRWRGRCRCARHARNACSAQPDRPDGRLYDPRLYAAAKLEARHDGVSHLARHVALAHRSRCVFRPRIGGSGRVHALARPLGAAGRDHLVLRSLAVASTSSSPSRHSRSPRFRFGGSIARGVEKPGDQPFLNRRADAFVGREFTLEKPIVGGSGTVKIDDTIWRLRGPDVPGGSRVKVVRADAATLVVEAV